MISVIMEVVEGKKKKLKKGDLVLIAKT